MGNLLTWASTLLTLTLKGPQKLVYTPKAFITHDELSVVGTSGLDR
jgi:hypothetical protein